MAISIKDIAFGSLTTSISGVVYGDLATTNIDISTLSKTQKKTISEGDTTGVDASSFKGGTITSPLASIPASLGFPTVGVAQTIKISSTCAWEVARTSGSSNFVITGITQRSATVSGSGSSIADTIGGDASVNIVCVSGSVSAVLTWTYSDGAGGSSTTTTNLSQP